MFHIPLSEPPDVVLGRNACRPQVGLRAFKCCIGRSGLIRPAVCVQLDRLDLLHSVSQLVSRLISIFAQFPAHSLDTGSNFLDSLPSAAVRDMLCAL